MNHIGFYDKIEIVQNDSPIFSKSLAEPHFSKLLTDPIFSTNAAGKKASIDDRELIKKKKKKDLSPITSWQSSQVLRKKYLSH